MKGTRLLLLPIGGLVLGGCAGSLSLAGPSASEPSVSGQALVRTATVEVYKSPSCECCHEWEAYLREHGVTVRPVPTEDMAAVKDARGVPSEAMSCHTAIVDGYTVEGHVPVEAIEDLLTERPDIDGIALPGMPPGSPGMPGEKEAPFEILAIDDGTLSAYGAY